MPTLRQFSLYYTDSEMHVWKSFAAARGLTIGKAIRDLAARGLESYSIGDTGPQLRSTQLAMLPLLMESLSSNRVLLQHIDKSGGLQTTAKIAAEKMWQKHKELGTE